MKTYRTIAGLTPMFQGKGIDFIVAVLLSITLVAGATISVALYAGFEGFHRGELAVKQTYSDDLPKPLMIEVRDDYEMVKSRYSWVAGALLTALLLHLLIGNRAVNWLIIGPLVVAAYQFMVVDAYQFKGIFWFKNAAFSSDSPRFAFMRDTYSLDMVVCGLIVIAVLSLCVRLYRTRGA